MRGLLPVPGMQRGPVPGLPETGPFQGPDPAHGIHLWRVHGVEGSERRKGRRRIPVVDPVRCSECEACLDLCPEVFRRNPDTGRIEVLERSDYPEEAVAEVIANCPKDCIDWEEI